MKALYIIPQLGCGGAEILLGDIMYHLKTKFSWNIKLICLQNHDPTLNEHPRFEFIQELKPIIINCKTQFNLFHGIKFNNLELQTIIDEFKPDIIHTHLYYTEIISRSVYYPKAKWFTHCHDNMPQFRKANLFGSSLKKAFLHYLERRTLFRNYKRNGGTTFIAVSDHTAEYLKKTLPKAFRSNITTLLNAVALDRFKRSKGMTDKIRLINIGKFVPKKNQVLIADILQKLQQQNLEPFVTLCGSGPELEEVKQRFYELNLSEKVNFTGNTHDIAMHLSSSNIYLHTATYEPFGLVLIEAMASGLPVIAMDAGGSNELIIDGYNGFVVKSGELDKFVEKIKLLAYNPEVYAKISQNAFDFSRKFDIKNYMDRLVKLYQS